MDTGLRVAVTGPTGEIGRSFVRALEQQEAIGTIRGMARRPFDPRAYGWHRTEYVQGDVLDRDAVRSFVEGADVVVHLAFVIFGSRAETRRVNLEGSRNVFDASVAAGARRLVYTSSVAAYGFHADNPQPLTEDVPARGSEEFYYSAQKAELEAALEQALAGTDTVGYVLRPSIVGGPHSPALLTNHPYVQVAGHVPDALRRAVGHLPGTRPVMPDFGVPLQLVHADDVAAALVAATLGHGPPGAYNLAADGQVSMADLAEALGWRSVRVPRAVVGATTAVLARLPVGSARLEWAHTLRMPVIMDTSRARRQLGWAPQHDAHDTLHATIAGAREAGIV